MCALSRLFRRFVWGGGDATRAPVATLPSNGPSLARLLLGFELSLLRYWENIAFSMQVGMMLVSALLACSIKRLAGALQSLVPEAGPNGVLVYRLWQRKSRL